MNKKLLIIFLAFQVSHLQAQRCIGSLGDNLFVAGDFGSGPSYAILNDPGLAPGYSYNAIGPPNDGQYIITSDISRWPSVFPTWLRIPDNSTNPDGYMMVVNASYEPGLFYEELITDLCDNTIFEFSADVINIVRREVPDHILPNVDFLINDQVVFNTGDIRQDESWHRYSFSFTTDPGQTDLKLSLRNNAPGGIGNDLALDNISFRACGPPGTISSSAGDFTCMEDLPVQFIALLDSIEETDKFYQWEILSQGAGEWNVMETESGSRITLEEYEPGGNIIRFATSASPASFTNLKCRFYSEPYEILIPERNFEIYDTICGGTDLPFGSELISTPGRYTLNLVSSAGCDSILTYYLDTIRRATVTAQLDITDPVCHQQNTGMIVASDPEGGYPPYFIETNGIRFQSLSATDLPAGEYEVYVKDRFGCFYEDVALLEDPPRFEISLGQDQSHTLGQISMVSLASSEIPDLIEWEPPLEAYNDVSSFSFLPLDNMTVRVRAANMAGCEAKDEMNIFVNDDVQIYISDIFSPNGDGINDEFNISAVGLSLESIRTFEIYNRWGSVIWSAIDAGPDTFWNGKDSKGRDANPGVYIYRVETILINGRSNLRTGTITLIR